MFSFFARQKSLDAQRQKSLDAQRHIRRLVDLTVPNNDSQNSGRYENRFNRALPVLICPTHGGKPDAKCAVIAITKDLSDRGAAIITHQPIEPGEAIVCFHLNEVGWFFRGVFRTPADMGGGFWQNGVEFTDFLEPASDPELLCLMPLARELRPPDALDRAQSLVQQALL